MKRLVRVIVLTLLGCCGTQGQGIPCVTVRTTEKLNHGNTEATPVNSTDCVATYILQFLLLLK